MGAYIEIPRDTWYYEGIHGIVGDRWEFRGIYGSRREFMGV